MTHLGSFPGFPPTLPHPHHRPQGSQNPTSLRHLLPGSQLSQEDRGLMGAHSPPRMRRRGSSPPAPSLPGHWEEGHWWTEASSSFPHTDLWDAVAESLKEPTVACRLPFSLAQPQGQGHFLLFPPKVSRRQGCCGNGTVQPAPSPLLPLSPEQAGLPPRSPTPEGGVSHALAWSVDPAACSPLHPQNRRASQGMEGSVYPHTFLSVNILH